MGYKILLAPVVWEQEIKKSKFITYLSHTDNMINARNFWGSIKKLHPNARHHCWATITGAPKNSMTYGFSDDGEPSGTAGKPMLSCLSGSDIGEISAVVVRYFGGILLGTGGLVKAYATSVQQAIAQATTIEKTERITCELFCDYSQIDMIYNFLLKMGALITNQTFTQNIYVMFEINPDLFEIINSHIANKTAGTVKIKKPHLK